jgi:aspartate carbamoyltransferase catalytic subunit
MLTIRQHKGTDFSRLKVVIAGDILHSRVARSGLQALKMLGCGEIRVCGPDSLMPTDGTLDGCHRLSRFDDAVAGADVLMMLRLQRERMEQGLVDSSERYFTDYGLDPRRLALAAPDAMVMHPGPMNRGVEIADAVADGNQSVIFEQVSNGVAVRMAVLQAVFAA